jgi:C4-dicarboxylate transporter DctM subunit
METLSAILILAPILFSVVKHFDVNVIHFGIILVINLTIGFATPPVGVNLFVACGLTDMKFDELMKAIWPFIAALLIGLMLITYIPEISLFIPQLFGK